MDAREAESSIRPPFPTLCLPRPAGFGRLELFLRGSIGLLRTAETPFEENPVYAYAIIRGN